MNYDLKELATRKGALVLSPKAAHTADNIMLTVYAFLTLPDLRRGGYQQRKVKLQRVLCPKNTPLEERKRILQALCDLVAVQYGVECFIRK